MSHGFELEKAFILKRGAFMSYVWDPVILEIQNSLSI